MVAGHAHPPGIAAVLVKSSRMHDSVHSRGRMTRCKVVGGRSRHVVDVVSTWRADVEAGKVTRAQRLVECGIVKAMVGAFQGPGRGYLKPRNAPAPGTNNHCDDGSDDQPCGSDDPPTHAGRAGRHI